MRARRLAAVVICAGMSLSMAACSSLVSPAAVGRGDRHGVSAVPSTNATTTTATSTTQSSPQAPTSTAPAATFDTQTLNQIGAGLGPLDSALSTANSDLSNPQGDS